MPTLQQKALDRFRKAISIYTDHLEILDEKGNPVSLSTVISSIIDDPTLFEGAAVEYLPGKITIYIGMFMDHLLTDVKDHQIIFLEPGYVDCDPEILEVEKTTASLLQRIRS